MSECMEEEKEEQNIDRDKAYKLGKKKKTKNNNIRAKEAANRINKTTSKMVEKEEFLLKHIYVLENDVYTI
jgi:hypothetical protein